MSRAKARAACPLAGGVQPRGQRAIPAHVLLSEGGSTRCLSRSGKSSCPSVRHQQRDSSRWHACATARGSAPPVGRIDPRLAFCFPCDSTLGHRALVALTVLLLSPGGRREQDGDRSSALRDEQRPRWAVGQSRTEALTGIIGGRRAWTVSTISPLSIPCRHTDVIPRLLCPELALDDNERDAFASHLDGVCVTGLVRGRPAPDSRCGGGASQLGACRGGRPLASARSAVDDAQQQGRTAACAGCQARTEVVPIPMRPCPPRDGARPFRAGLAVSHGVDRGRPR
jgi:hypothetical protein